MRTIAALLGLITVILSGCANFGRPAPDPEDVSVQARHRREDVVRSFEGKRDQAQIASAVTRWKSGDVKGCREALDKLLERNPKYREGQLLMAELLLSEQQPEAAIAQLQQVLADNPSDPRAHHAMGLALEAEGQTDEAIESFKRAGELAPKNELYALSYKTAREASRMETQAAREAPVAGRADWSTVSQDAATCKLLSKSAKALDNDQVDA